MIEILKFYTPTCAPCRMVGKVLEGYIKDKENIKLTNIDAMESVDKVDEYNIFSTPTLVFLKDGKEVARKTGLVNKADLENIMAEITM